MNTDSCSNCGDPNVAGIGPYARQKGGTILCTACARAIMPDYVVDSMLADTEYQAWRRSLFEARGIKRFILRLLAPIRRNYA